MLFLRYLVNADHFEWYHGYTALSGLMARLMTKDQHVMLSGCGTSSLAADMHTTHRPMSVLICVSLTRISISFPVSDLVTMESVLQSRGPCASFELSIVLIRHHLK